MPPAPGSRVALSPWRRGVVVLDVCASVLGIGWGLVLAVNEPSTWAGFGTVSGWPIVSLIGLVILGLTIGLARGSVGICRVLLGLWGFLVLALARGAVTSGGLVAAFLCAFAVLMAGLHVRLLIPLRASSPTAPTPA